MKKLSILVFPFLLMVPSLSANIITLDNNPGSVAMYSNLTDAYNAAEDGDTILVAGSADSYGRIDSYKDLTIIGPGWRLSENNIPGLSTVSATLHVNFHEDPLTGDSSGSSCIGLFGQFNSDPEITDILIDKCTTAWAWRFKGPVTITRCIMGSTLTLDVSNSSISNSILSTVLLQQPNISVTNCVINISIDAVPNTTITNTIFRITDAAKWDNDPSFDYCMTVGSSFLPEGNGNLNDQSQAAVFAQTSSDSFYQLKEGSPAIGAGLGGADMGAFGGPKPYVLAGLPGVPRLTRLTVPTTATGLTALTFEVEAEAFPE